jgi:hypothetical protein
VAKKTITVKGTTFERLAKLKEALGYTTWDEVLSDFANCVERAVKRELASTNPLQMRVTVYM